MTIAELSRIYIGKLQPVGTHIVLQSTSHTSLGTLNAIKVQRLHHSLRIRNHSGESVQLKDLPLRIRLRGREMGGSKALAFARAVSSKESRRREVFRRTRSPDQDLVCPMEMLCLEGLNTLQGTWSPRGGLIDPARPGPEGGSLFFVRSVDMLSETFSFRDRDHLASLKTPHAAFHRARLPRVFQGAGAGRGRWKPRGCGGQSFDLSEGNRGREDQPIRTCLRQKPIPMG